MKKECAKYHPLTKMDTTMRPALLTLLSLACLPVAGTLAEDVNPLKVLMVCGGCCHDYENQKLILSEGISARANVEFTIVHEEARVKDDRTHQVSIYKQPDWAKGYDVVLHNECFGAVTDVAFVNGIAKPHFDGVPAVMLHCSTHSYRAAQTDEWRKCLGQTSMKHEKNRDLKVRNVAGDHPIMKGFPKEWLDPKDELYENIRLWENFKPLATAYGEDTKKDHHCIWTNQYGAGRVFGTTLGHNNSTMQDPVYLDLVTRGLLWACGKLSEDGKPLPGYEAKRK